ALDDDVFVWYYARDGKRLYEMLVMNVRLNNQIITFVDLDANLNLHALNCLVLSVIAIVQPGHSPSLIQENNYIAIFYFSFTSIYRYISFKLQGNKIGFIMFFPIRAYARLYKIQGINKIAQRANMPNEITIEVDRVNREK
ncbi:hypothetical protein ACJX0J_035342, partial [Zea mays]